MGPAGRGRDSLPGDVDGNLAAAGARCASRQAVEFWRERMSARSETRVTSVWRARFMKSSAEWRVYEGGGVYKCNRSLSPRPTRVLYRAPPRLRHGLRRGARLDLR
jgi:hypothetical protein